MALSFLIICAHVFIDKYLFKYMYVCTHLYLHDARTPRELEKVKMDVMNAAKQSKKSHLLTLLT